MKRLMTILVLLGLAAGTLPALTASPASAAGTQSHGSGGGAGKNTSYQTGGHGHGANRDPQSGLPTG